MQLGTTKLEKKRGSGYFVICNVLVEHEDMERNIWNIPSDFISWTYLTQLSFTIMAFGDILAAWPPVLSQPHSDLLFKILFDQG